MAIYHLRVDKIGRSMAQSAVASASYYSDEPLLDRRTGIRHVMLPRQGLLHSEIIFPAGADEASALDRQSLRNAVEACEHRRDSNIALLWHVALPRELDTRAAIDLAKSFARYLIEREGNVIDLTVRETSPGSSIGYLLATTRQFQSSGFGAKVGFVLGGRIARSAVF